MFFWRFLNKKMQLRDKGNNQSRYIYIAYCFACKQ